MNGFIANAVSLMAIVITMLTGSYFTVKSTQSTWYDCIKPWFTPPSVVFPIAWTILYVLLFLLLSKNLLLENWVKVGLLGVVLVLHVLWCYFYFGRRQVLTGVIVIGLLNVVNVAMLWVIVNGNRQERSFDLWMFVPHVIWILFATLLNVGSMNKLGECIVI